MPNARMNCFVDTTLLVYAIDPGNRRKQEIAADLLRAIVRDGTLVLSAQSLNELYRVATDRRSLLTRKEARAAVERLARFCTAPYDFEVTRHAWRIQDEHGFSYWDCVLLASAALAGCGTFFSENMQRGRRVQGLIIVNPFETGRHLMQ
jgi:predicted nucleic acid-binding protein